MKLVRIVLLALALVAGLPLASSLLGSVAAPLGLDALAVQVDGVGSAQAAFIRRNVLKKSPVTGYRVIVVVGEDTADEVAAVALEIPTVEGQPVPSTNSMVLAFKKIRPNGNKRYVFSDVSFSSDAVGFSYNTVATMLDEAGEQVGEQRSFTVTVTDPPPDADDAEVHSAGIVQLNGSNFLLKVLVDDPALAVDSVTVDFDADMNDGLPTPSSTSVVLENPIVVRSRTIYSLDTLTFPNIAGAIDQVYTVALTLRDASGEVIDVVGADLVVQGLDVSSPGAVRLALEASQIEAELANALIDTLGLELNAISEEIEAEQIVLPPRTQLRIQSTVHFIDDWQSE